MPTLKVAFCNDRKDMREVSLEGYLEAFGRGWYIEPIPTIVDGLLYLPIVIKVGGEWYVKTYDGKRVQWTVTQLNSSDIEENKDRLIIQSL